MSDSLSQNRDSQTDTIAAFATALGGAVAVIRASGPDALSVAGKVWTGRVPLSTAPVRALRLGAVHNGDGPLDGEVLATYMPGPHSFTGEDVVELHCHGGALGARLTLLALLAAGCRHAEPGEFTRRAFLNGRLDLTQAEAVADLIEAHSESALHMANRQLGGLLGRRIRELYDALAELLADVESRLDFAEEDLGWRPADSVREGVDGATVSCQELLASRREGEILREGVVLVLAGAPNVGKSSLLNAILGRDRAIVTDIPGTTRDTLEELAHIRGIPVRLVDTAGIREADNLIEQTGIERSRDSIRRAQVVLWIVDASVPYEPQAWRSEEHPFAGPVLVVANKSDCGTQNMPTEALATCALTGEGLDGLYDAIERAVWDAPHHHESEVAVSARHGHCLDQAIEALVDARLATDHEEWELVSAAVRAAIASLGQITGQTADPDILDTIFLRFCIGK
ncbi:MAG: tRNA uridine-5-carboxymethylaminomethyl(34) synthesis GTPase MnmE [Victivallales bacterium]|jgi:tRNA modification GTPase|nr:tRNA uridine-5-carboxymethylaminomethyl(34) synthesis GTPase MnmE [Victivallales bacterium]